MESREIVVKTLKESKKPLKGGEISTISGLDKKEVDKAIKALIKENQIYSPQRCFYDIKK